MTFTEWFNTHLTVAAYPDTWQAVDSDGKYRNKEVFINVSDEFQLLHHSALCRNATSSYWFPLGECQKDMGLISIYGALQVLWHSWKRSERVLLHCHAGLNRSPTVQQAFYFMVTGSHLPEESRNGLIYKANMLQHNCGRHLPELPVMEKWLQACQQAFTKPEKYIGGMYDWTLREAGIA